MNRSTLTFEECTQLLQEKRYTDINDFDNHLDDLKVDWRNLKLEQVIHTISCSVETSSKRIL